MNESRPREESFERLPSEKEVFDVVTLICGERRYTEVSREERGGKLRGLTVWLDEVSEDGLRTQLDYIVNAKGVPTIDATFYDPHKGHDYSTYDPQDIVSGMTLGRFVNGVWHGEGKL